jgi:hypothetical protein
MSDKKYVLAPGSGSFSCRCEVSLAGSLQAYVGVNFSVCLNDN